MRGSAALRTTAVRRLQIIFFCLPVRSIARQQELSYTWLGKNAVRPFMSENICYLSCYFLKKNTNNNNNKSKEKNREKGREKKTKYIQPVYL